MDRKKPEEISEDTTTKKSADTSNVNAVMPKKLKFCLFLGNNSTVFRRILLNRGCWEEKFTVMDEIQKTNPFRQMINHFEDNNALCSKTGLVRSLGNYYRFHEQANVAHYGAFDTMATSFILTAGSNDNEMAAFIKRFNQISSEDFSKEKVPRKHCSQNMWLLKPADLNQGRGIEIVKSAIDMCAALNARQQPSSKWIVQKYIERPLLYHGRKFDIRIWVLITKSCDIFFYEKGYIRTCCDTYSMTDDNPNLHLTNNYVQKKDKNYGAHEQGNTLPLENLFEYIDQLCRSKGYSSRSTTQSVKEQLISRMKDLVIDTILSAKKSLLTPKKMNTFELFGYDFLIDEDFRLWLIEVNTNPYIGTPNKYIEELVPQMAEDLVQLTVDQMFPPPPQEQKPQRENLFELIYCEAGSTFNPVPKNVRSSFSESIYPIESLAQKPNKPLRTFTVSQSKPKLINSPQNLMNQSSARFTTPVSAIQSVTNSLPQTARGINLQNSLIQIKLDDSMEVAPINELPTEENLENKATIEVQQPSQVAIQTKSPMFSLHKRAAIAPAEILEIKQLPDFEQLQFQLKKLSNASSINPSDLQLVRTLFLQILKKLITQLTDISTTTLPQNEQQFYQKNCMKSLKATTNSKFLQFLVDDELINLLCTSLENQSPFFKELQLIIAQTLVNLTKSSSQSKSKIASNPQILTALIKTALLILREDTQNDQIQLNLSEVSLECLIQLLGIYNRRMYIPGETHLNDKIRRQVIEAGGLLPILAIKQKRMNVLSTTNQKALKDSLEVLELADLDYQLSVLQPASSIHSNQDTLIAHWNSCDPEAYNTSVAQLTSMQAKFSNAERARKDFEKSKKRVEELRDQQLASEKKQKLFERRAILIEYQRRKEGNNSATTANTNNSHSTRNNNNGLNSTTTNTITNPSNTINVVGSSNFTPLQDRTKLVEAAEYLVIPQQTNKNLASSTIKLPEPLSTRLLSHKQLLSMTSSQHQLPKHSPHHQFQQPISIAITHTNNTQESQKPNSIESTNNFAVPQSPLATPNSLDPKQLQQSQLHQQTNRKKLPAINLTYEMFISLKKKQFDKKTNGQITPVYSLDSMNSSLIRTNKPLRLKPILQTYQHSNQLQNRHNHLNPSQLVVHEAETINNSLIYEAISQPTVESPKQNEILETTDAIQED